MAQHLIDRYGDRLHGVLSCYDRVVVTGTLPQVCYAPGMTAFLYTRGIRIFDYPRFAEPLRDAIRARAQELSESAGIEIEHTRDYHGVSGGVVQTCLVHLIRHSMQFASWKERKALAKAQSTRPPMPRPQPQPWTSSSMGPGARSTRPSSPAGGAAGPR